MTGLIFEKMWCGMASLRWHRTFSLASTPDGSLASTPHGSPPSTPWTPRVPYRAGLPCTSRTPKNAMHSGPTRRESEGSWDPRESQSCKCPARVRKKGIIKAIKCGRYEKAIGLLKKTTPGKKALRSVMEKCAKECINISMFIKIINSWNFNKANLRDFIAATGLVDSCYWPSNVTPIWFNSVDFSASVKLQFDGWPRKIIGHLFYITSNFVRHLKLLSEFKLEFLSRNTQFGSKWAIFLSRVTLNLMDNLKK